MMANSILVIFLCLAVSYAAAEGTEDGARNGKILPIFNVVTFPNDLCDGDAGKNGTCYTGEQCSSRGGKSDGNCASGFGTCCVFDLGCGGSSSENNTYLTQTSSSTITSPCEYTICPMNSDICRIRFDFTTHVLTAPVLGTTAAATLNVGAAIGQCITDQFSISGAPGTPVICGTNSGYHMIVDARADCHKASFAIGGGTTSRQWDIFVSQYACGEEDVSRGGPPGCLQYHTGTTGDIQSFAFPTSNTVTTAVTHLANQEYDICIRRESGRCFICYIPYGPATTTVNDEGTFGVSVSTNANNIAQSSVNTRCIFDYVQIANGAATPGTLTTVAATKICGRFFQSQDGQVANVSVCTLSVPFRVGVHFDGYEENTLAGAANADTNEQLLFPGGIIGFRLRYAQGNCT